MELCNPELIRALIAGFGNPTSVPRRHGEQRAAMPATKPLRRHQCKQGAAMPAARNAGMPCRCGHCRQCLDNARWERVFEEKFKDPDYYTRPVVSIGSSLTSL